MLRCRGTEGYIEWNSLIRNGCDFFYIPLAKVNGLDL